MVESNAEYVPAVLVLDSIDISQIIPLELTFQLVLNTKFLSILTAVNTPLPLPGYINTSFMLNCMDGMGSTYLILTTKYYYIRARIPYILKTNISINLYNKYYKLTYTTNIIN